MSNKFTHPTYGEIHYVVENDKFIYCNPDVEKFIGDDYKISGGFRTSLRKRGLYRKYRFGNRNQYIIGLGLQEIQHLRDLLWDQVGHGARSSILYEWLREQEESARNGAPCVPEPVETEQSTESKNCLSKFDSTFDAFTVMMNGEIEKRQQMLEACNGLRDGALKYKEMYYAEKAQNATLRAQVDELQQQLADGDITDIVNNNTKLRYMLGGYKLQRYADDYYHDHNDILRYQDAYTPTQMADFVKNMSKFSMHISAQVVNRKLEEAGYQEHCDSNEEGAYKLTSWIDESYAYKTFIKGNNDFVLPSLVWTKKGLALFIGLLLDTEAIEGTCI